MANNLRPMIPVPSALCMLFGSGWTSLKTNRMRSLKHRIYPLIRQFNPDLVKRPHSGRIRIYIIVSLVVEFQVGRQKICQILPERRKLSKQILQVWFIDSVKITTDRALPHFFFQPHNFINEYMYHAIMYINAIKCNNQKLVFETLKLI